MVKSYQINTFGLPVDTARKIWREIVDETYVLDKSASKEVGYRFFNEIWFVEDLLFAKVKAEKNTIIRTPELNTNRPTPIMKVKFFKHGSSTLWVGSEKFNLGCNAIHFIDHNRPMRETYSDHELLSIFLPYHAIGCDPSSLPAVLSLELNSTLGRLVETTFEIAFQQIDVIDDAEIPILGKAITGILNSILTVAVNSERYTDFHRARSYIIMRFIDQNLDNRSLDVDLLINRFGVSRATLFREFADVGGVKSYILSCRLQRAYRDLSESQPGRGVVKAVAERWGFSSHAHFSKVFNRQFLVSPSSLVGRWTHERHDAVAEDDALKRENLSVDIAALKWAYARYR